MEIDGHTYTMHRKPALQPMRPYAPGEDLSAVSVSDEDTPAAGDWIAISPANPADKWLVNAAFYEKNYEAA